MAVKYYCQVVVVLSTRVRTMSSSRVDYRCQAPVSSTCIKYVCQVRVSSSIVKEYNTLVNSEVCVYKSNGLKPTNYTHCDGVYLLIWHLLHGGWQEYVYEGVMQHAVTVRNEAHHRLLL